METDQQSPLEEKFTILVVDTEGGDVESRRACMQAEDNHVCEVGVQGSMTVGRPNAWIAHNFSHPQWLVVQGRIIEDENVTVARLGVRAGQAVQIIFRMAVQIIFLCLAICSSWSSKSGS